MPKKLTPIQITILVAVVAILATLIYQNYLVAATVNGKPISRLAVITELEKQGGKKTLDSIITRALIVEQAHKEHISVSADELNKEIKKIETTITAQGGTIDEALKQQGLTKDDLSKDVGIQLTVQKLVKADTIKITDEEVAKYMKDNKDQFPADAKIKPDTNQIKESLKQEKVQAKIQAYITDLHAKAKITYFGSYK